MLSRIVFLFILSFGLAYADSKADKAEAAVADILFEYGLDEFATYNIDEDGSVDITFPNNTPNKIFGEILGALRAHKDIDADNLMPGRGGPACSMF